MRKLTDLERAEQRYVETQIDLLQFADAIVRGEIACWHEREKQAADCLQKFLDADRAYRDAIDGGRLAALTEQATKSPPGAVKPSVRDASVDTANDQ